MLIPNEPDFPNWWGVDPNRRRRRRRRRRRQQQATAGMWPAPNLPGPKPIPRDPQLPRPGSGGSGGSGGTPTPGMTKDQLSAFELFKKTLQAWGFPMGADIEKIIRAAVLDGITPDKIYLIEPDIQQTQTFKNRFPGWHSRLSSGYNQITVAEYLDLEDRYHSILRSYGLPSGFYDSPSDYGDWIAKNISPEEIEARVSMAVGLTNQVHGAARDLLAKFYGVTSGDLAAYFLDADRALPNIDRQYKAVNVAQWAARNGLEVWGASYYEDLVDSGITAEQAAAGFSAVRSFTDTLSGLGNLYGIDYGQQDAEGDVFFNRSDKRRRIVAAEMSQWRGTSRGDTGSADRGTGY